MQENNLLIHETTFYLEQQRTNNQFIMDWFAKEGYSSAELAWLNRCRLYLQATTLSDIASSDGSKILSTALEGRHMRRPSTYNWDPQNNPSQSCWKLLTQALQSSFDIQ
eukprot:11467332-Ditylum_brightwellii.AAC.1